MTQNDTGTAIVFGFFVIWGLVALVAIAFTVFWIIEIIDVARREFDDPNAKILWLLIVLFLHGIGALIYFFVGKPQGRLPGEGLLPRTRY